MASPIIQMSPKTLQRVSEAHQEDNCEISICSYSVQVKRLFIPIVGCLGFLALPEFQTYIYLPLLVFVTFFVIFWNFPCIITFMNSKPLYYEDLFLAGTTAPSSVIDPRVRRKFESAFEWSLICTNSLFAAALSEYWLYQSDSANSYVEMVGVTGGILKIFQSVNHMNGGIILHITRSFINKELNNASSIEGKGPIVELVEFDHEIRPSPHIEDNKDSPVVIHITDSNKVIASTSDQVSQDALRCDRD